MVGGRTIGSDILAVAISVWLVSALTAARCLLAAMHVGAVDAVCCLLQMMLVLLLTRHFVFKRSL